MRGYTFSQGYSLYFFSFLLLYGVLKLGSWIGFRGWAFQLMGFGACGVGASGFFEVGALYINIDE